MSKPQRSFTLIELTMVAAIIGLLAAIILANYRGGERQSALLRSTHQLAQDLRRVEEMAISSQKTPPEFGEEVFPRGGYGIYFKIDPEAPKGYRIILFADCDGEGDYDESGTADCAGAAPEFGLSRDETIEELTLEEGVVIEALSPSSPKLSITFKPPDPEITIFGGGDIAAITLSLKDAPAIARIVTINKVGLIDTKKYAVCFGVPNNTQAEGCNGLCQACQNGTCGFANVGTDPGNDCTGAYSCSGFITRLRNMCNGSDACADINAAASDCSGTCANYCSGGNCIDADTEAGTCIIATDVRVVSGGDGRCANFDCVSGCYANGTACTPGSQCCFGNCVDDVCCNTACTGSTCQRCDSYSNAGAGTCGYVSTAVDPDNECGTTDCLTGNCKGDSYACGYYTSGQHNCSTGYVCNASGNCELSGIACTSGSQCDSGFCVDDVCCNTACTGSTCQRCDSYSNAGAGTCGYVSSSSQDPDNECSQGSTALDGCRSNNCSGTGYACGVQTTGKGGCPACGYCGGIISCEYPCGSQPAVGPNACINVCVEVLPL